MKSFKENFMSTVRKTITLTKQQDEWIKSHIKSGDYTNDSEFIRDLIRKDQENKLDVEAIRFALIEGEMSGDAVPFDFEVFQKKMEAKYE